MANTQPSEIYSTDGILEMHLHVKPRPSTDANLPALGSKLMMMDFESFQHRQYIENKLTTYFDIQIFSKIYIGSNH